MSPEARLAFWAVSYLVHMHRTGHNAEAEHRANEALKDFDEAASDILTKEQRYDDQRPA